MFLFSIFLFQKLSSSPPLPAMLKGSCPKLALAFQACRPPKPARFLGNGHTGLRGWYLHNDRFASRVASSQDQHHLPGFHKFAHACREEHGAAQKFASAGCVRGRGFRLRLLPSLAQAPAGPAHRTGSATKPPETEERTILGIVPQLDPQAADGGGLEDPPLLSTHRQQPLGTRAERKEPHFR